MTIIERWCAALEEDFFNHERAVRRLLRRHEKTVFEACVKRADLAALAARVASLEARSPTAKKRR